uniref:Uncharacterized protein n=2 Tax=Opuntia streptacantha TaxID=393608 RepID=A0A7C9D4M7_OPUST
MTFNDERGRYPSLVNVRESRSIAMVCIRKQELARCCVICTDDGTLTKSQHPNYGQIPSASITIPLLTITFMKEVSKIIDNNSSRGRLKQMKSSKILFDGLVILHVLDLNSLKEVGGRINPLREKRRFGFQTAAIADENDVAVRFCCTIQRILKQQRCLPTALQTTGWRPRKQLNRFGVRLIVGAAVGLPGSGTTGGGEESLYH